MKKHLPDVTLCAVTAHAAITLRAIEICRDAFDFADTLIVAPFVIESAYRCLNTPIKYDEFCVKEMHKHFDTKFVLIVQYDGYIINPQCWRDDFLDYDYIGAIWPWIPDGKNVGNGGFCLRSKRLLELAAEKPFQWAGDDVILSRTYRPCLEQEHGIRYAPSDLARQFSYERELVTHPTLGFHGLYNMGRHVHDHEMLRLIKDFTVDITNRSEFAELITFYWNHGKRKMSESLMERRKELEWEKFRKGNADA